MSATRASLKPVEVDLFLFTGDLENLKELDKWLLSFGTPDNPVDSNWVKSRDKIKINIAEPFGTGKIIVQPGDTIVRWPNSTFSCLPKDLCDVLFGDPNDEEDTVELTEVGGITFAPRK